MIKKLASYLLRGLGFMHRMLTMLALVLTIPGLIDPVWFITLGCIFPLYMLTFFFQKDIELTDAHYMLLYVYIPYAGLFVWLAIDHYLTHVYPAI